MDPIYYGTEAQRKPTYRRRSEWRFLEKGLLALVYISLLIQQSNCQTILKNESSHISESLTKRDLNKVDLKTLDPNHCHSCHTSSSNIIDNIKNSKLEKANNVTENEIDTEKHGVFDEMLEALGEFTEKYVLKFNRTDKEMERQVEKFLDNAFGKEKYVIMDGIEIKSIAKKKDFQSWNQDEKTEGRALFSKMSYEYRLVQRIKDFVDTHILSISLPKAAGLMGFRSFGLKKFFVPLLIGAQVFKSIIFAMFLPSILGSFGKILGKGISQLSASSSQASYPPANMDDPEGYNTEKDVMAYETDPAGAYTYPQDGMYVNMADPNDVNDLANGDLSRFGANSQKMNYLPAKNGYYKNQMQTAATNNYKVFQKIPASSMILSNYDPFYSPLLSRLDGIFARLGLAPAENAASSQALSDVKLEACREQLICFMYNSPAKYAPYSNLVSAQLSRELNDLRRPVSDNPEILRFFRYMRAARRGQEGTDCMRAHPACSTVASPQHTMFAAFNDINKLVTARKLAGW